MTKKSERCISVTAVLLAVIWCVAAARADEGMWLFTHPPKKELKQRYDFDPPESWYAHLQRAAVRFNVGGSAEFVSSDGLVLTNHHIGIDSLQKLSTKEKDYVANGFYAHTRDEELKCPGVELDVLMSIEDVTPRVKAAVCPGSSSAAAEEARRAAINAIEQESLEKTGLRSDVVTLYQGGLFHLYRYKKVYRCAHGVCAGRGGGQFWGRYGQFRVSALLLWTPASSVSTKTASLPRSSTF